MFAAQNDVNARDFGNFLALELGIAARNDHQRIRVLADEMSDVLATLAVG